MKKRILACLLALVMLIGVLPVMALAEDASTGPEVYVDAKNGSDAGNGTQARPYKTVGKALTDIKDGATVHLAEGVYYTYTFGHLPTHGPTYCKGLNVTFIGAGPETVWYIGTPTVAQTGETNGDYSFDGAESVTFQNMTLRASAFKDEGEAVFGFDYNRNYTGFIRIKHTIVKDCVIEGRTAYWGYISSDFVNTKFDAPDGYALWYYTGNEMTFDSCVFNVNADGRTIHVYREGNDSVIKENVKYGDSAENPIVLNLKDCEFYAENPNKETKQVLNIKEYCNSNRFYYVVNFSGNTVVDGISVNNKTCSRLFQVQGVADGYNCNEDATGNGKSGLTTVNIDGKTVWANGKMVKHNVDITGGSYDDGVAEGTANKYTDGYKDNAFDILKATEWTQQSDGSYERKVTRKCKYCGYTETVKEVKKDDIVDIIPVILPAISKNETAPKLNTRDHFAYVQGYPDGTVKPAGSITRAEVAAILFRLMDADSRSLYYSTASGFRDVDSTKWYNTYVATLNNAGVITDSRTGYFRPNDAITRAELAAMLAQFAEKKSAAIYFSDISAGYWAANAIALTANLGWINGYPDGTFGPDKTVTRAELMAMVNRATGRAPESTSALLSGMKTWKDNADTARWYYLDVQEATNSHTYTGAPTETWTSLTATPDWSQYE